MHGAELLEWLARPVLAAAQTRIWLFVHWMHSVSLQLSCEWALSIFYLLTHERCCVTDDRPNLSTGRDTVRRQPNGELMRLFLRSGLDRWAGICTLASVYARC